MEITIIEIVVASLTGLFYLVRTIKNDRNKKKEKERNDNPIRVAGIS
jgi:hypothetical protein